MVSTSAPPTPSATHSGVDGAREATNVGVELKGVRGGVERRRVGVSGLKPRRGGRRDAPGDKVSPQGTAFTTPTGSYGNRRDEIERARRAPYSTPSAFKQGVALLREPIVVGAGETVAVTVDVRFDPEARDGRGCVTAKVARVDRERTPRGG